MCKKLIISILGAILVTGGPFVSITADAGLNKSQGTIGINVVLNTDVTDQILAELDTYGKVRDVLYNVNALTLKISADLLPTIQALPYVVDASPDAMRAGSPVDTVSVEDFVDGFSTWNLDAINVTDLGCDNREVAYDGTGVYVAVLDTGLVGTWRQYLPEERIAVSYAMSFGGGGGDKGWVSSQPKKWGLDVNSHGTHITSTILGYSFYGTPINGVSPMVQVIPVKVLNQTGSGWSSVIARGIEYVGELKAGPLANYPVIINMSLSGPHLDALEKAAIDYAIAQGVIIVASAGNEGATGMGYPGAYEPVISVAASGWTEEWTSSTWWIGDVADPTNTANCYVTDFSSRELTGQDLDVVAPGSWVVGPYQSQMGKISYYYLGGTSMASPHVAGTVALMAQKYPALTAAEAESILEASAIPLAHGCRTVNQPFGGPLNFCWGSDATGAGLLDVAAALDDTP